MDSYESTKNIIEKVKALSSDDTEPETLVRAIVSGFHNDSFGFERFVRSLLNYHQEHELYDDSPLAVRNRVEAVLPEDYILTKLQFQADNHTVVTIDPNEWEEN